MCVAFDNNNTELQIYLENGCTNTHKERRQSGTQFTLNIAILLYGEGSGEGAAVIYQLSGMVRTSPCAE